MKKLMQASAIVLFAGLFASCGSDAPKADIIQVENASTRGANVVNFKGKTLTLKNSDMIALSANKAKAADDDVAAIKNIAANFLSADNANAMLDAQLTLSEETVKDGTFVFALDINEQKNLTLELFDEEGFELAGANTIDVTEGKNYKAINVKSLNNGQYLMRLRDAEGKELTQKFTVSAE